MGAPAGAALTVAWFIAAPAAKSAFSASERPCSAATYSGVAPLVCQPTTRSEPSGGGWVGGGGVGVIEREAAHAAPNPRRAVRLYPNTPIPCHTQGLLVISSPCRLKIPLIYLACNTYQGLVDGGTCSKQGPDRLRVPRRAGGEQGGPVGWLSNTQATGRACAAGAWVGTQHGTATAFTMCKGH